MTLGIDERFESSSSETQCILNRKNKQVNRNSMQIYHFFTAHKDGWNRRMLSSSPERTPKFQLTAEPLRAECWIPPKIYPMPKGQRRSPNKMAGGVKSQFRIKTPHPPATFRGLNKQTLCASGPADPAETEPALPLSV